MRQIINSKSVNHLARQVVENNPLGERKEIGSGEVGVEYNCERGRGGQQKTSSGGRSEPQGEWGKSIPDRTSGKTMRQEKGHMWLRGRE